jgi:hypothetical protein
MTFARVGMLAIDFVCRELARIKADPTNQLEERVEQLSDQLDEAKVQLHQERGLSRWKGVLIQVRTLKQYTTGTRPKCTRR